jgi:N-hydroxyarylamine O-acetyltransferase
MRSGGIAVNFRKTPERWYHLRKQPLGIQAMPDTFRLTEYLKRIGVDGTVKADLTTLTAIHAAHVAAIPFEGLDPFLGRQVRLDLAGIQEKMLSNRRGGYCFEQNTLLKAALEAIGFSVTGLAGRVRWMVPPESPLGPRSHMLLKIDLPAGPYLADVGFGAFLLDCPLPIETNVEHSTAMGRFRLTQTAGMFSLNVKQPADWRTAYAFNLEPQLPSDYELANWYTSTNPRVPFMGTLIMERLTRDRRYKLVNNRLIIETRDGEVASERLIGSAEEFGQVLEQTFHISAPAPAQEIFARIGRPGPG